MSTMRNLAVASLALLISHAAAKSCRNITVPVTLSARTGMFNIDVPTTNLQATTFAQNLTRQGGNFTDEALAGYQTTSGTYQISTKFCQPDQDNVTNPTLQILTHGIGFDKTYWDLSYNNFNYSYINYAVDQYKYCTLSYDRLGIGNSTHGEPLNEIQSFLEVAALAEITNMFRAGNFPTVNHAFDKIVHVGHSFGSAQTYALVDLYPNISDGIVLTGFSTNGTFVPFFGAGADFVLANKNQPFRLGNGTLPVPLQVDNMAEELLLEYSLTDLVAGLSMTPAATPLDYADGYLTNSNINANQYLFFLPGHFDQGILLAGENTKQPVTVGELLTLGSLPKMNNFAGPVLVITGSNDLPYCGGDCFATGDPEVPSVPSTVAKSFPKGDFTAYIQPGSGHGINAHYNATGAYGVIEGFLGGKGLASS